MLYEVITDLDGHRQTIANVRAAAAAMGRRVAIFGDLPGPKMRIGQLAEEPLYLERGQTFTLLTKDRLGDESCASMSFKELPDVVRPGNDIFINDGLIQLDVERVDAEGVHCRVMSGGELRSFKGVNLPDIELGICAFTDQDHEFLRFAAELGIDGVSQSFVENASDRITSYNVCYTKLLRRWFARLQPGLGKPHLPMAGHRRRFDHGRWP